MAYKKAHKNTIKKLHASLFQEMLDVLARQDNAVVVIRSAHRVRIRFLNAVDLHYQEGQRLLTVAYRGPGGFWVEGCEPVTIDEAHGLCFSWAKAWLSAWRLRISQAAPGVVGRDFLHLCNDYAAQLTSSMPESLRSQWHTQMRQIFPEPLPAVGDLNLNNVILLGDVRRARRVVSHFEEPSQLDLLDVIR